MIIHVKSHITTTYTPHVIEDMIILHPKNNISKAIPCVYHIYTRAHCLFHYEKEDVIYINDTVKSITLYKLHKANKGIYNQAANAVLCI